MKTELKVKTKIVVFKDGSYKVCPDGVTYEYENDKDFLITIPLEGCRQKKLDNIEVGSEVICLRPNGVKIIDTVYEIKPSGIVKLKNGITTHLSSLTLVSKAPESDKGEVNEIEKLEWKVNRMISVYTISRNYEARGDIIKAWAIIKQIDREVKYKIE